MFDGGNLMTFFNWLQKHLQTITPSIRPSQRKRRGRHFDYHHRKRQFLETNRTAPLHPDETATSISKNDKSDPEPAKIVDPSPLDNQHQAQVIFSYLDEAEIPIAKSDIFHGIVGDKIQFKIPSFADYYLTAIDNFTYQFEATNQTVTFRFALKNGLPVMIYCLDTDTGQILRSVQILTGKLGHQYRLTAPEIKGFRVISSTGATYGQFDRQTHGVIFAYRRKNWETVQPVEYFVKLKNAHEVFNNPQGQTLKTGLPANIIIKVFARIDLADKSSWLNIGGFEWIRNTHLEPSNPPLHHLIEQITKTSRNPARLAGTINFVPHKAIAIFNKPYGKKTGALMHGSRVSITATIVDDQNLIWYELADAGVVPKAYVTVD